MADRILSDAGVIDAVQEAAWTINPVARRVLAPEGLYRRRKMTALIRRDLADASTGAMDRAMRCPGLQGVRRATKVRTTVCGAIAAAKIHGETAGVDRFRSKNAYARHNGTAPMPVRSSNKARHRLSRTGNRQLKAALHRIALTQAHWHEPAKQMLKRRKSRRRQRRGSTARTQTAAVRRRLRSTTNRPRLAVETTAA